ncbi:hypothetical protein C4565_02830 [Candidatus Parcubacteria bacterium]|nr:MAG: hypothetical protein C4565_02830 [Candidatus Parcubacteria bacterium]
MSTEIINRNLKNRIITIFNQDRLLYLLFVFFLWYAANPVFFERKFYINEILSFIGFLFFLSNPVIYKTKDYLYNSVILTLCIFFLYALLSLLFYKDLYGYLRNLVLVYSIFSFFLGIKFFNVLIKMEKHDPFFLCPLIVTALFSFHEFYRTGYAVTLPLYLTAFTKYHRWFSLYLIILTMLILREIVGGSTPVFIALFLVLLTILNQKRKIIALIIFLIASTLSMIYIKPYLDFLIKGVSLYDVLKIDPLLMLDGNATTRLFIWGFLLHKVFLFNIFGIGLGTPFLPKEFIWDNLMMWIKDPNIEYTIGAHNSFITILVRFGIIGFVPFILLYWNLIKDYINDRERKIHHRIIYLYYAFFIITGCALLNVVLESPIQSSLYWGTLGILYKAKEKDFQ